MSRFVHWLTINDQRAFYVVNRRMRCKLFDLIMPKITHLGGASITITFLAAMIMLSSDSIRLWSIEAFVSLGVSHGVVHMIKMIYCRPRPYNRLSGVHLVSNPLKDYSFPSGHTTAVFSIATVFAIHDPFLSAIFIPLAILVGTSRMYLGLHYPTDCIIGALLGICSSILVVSASMYLF